jgi:signal transduction histidine kinase
VSPAGTPKWGGLRSVRFIVFGTLVSIVAASQAIVFIGAQAQAQAEVRREQERSLGRDLLGVERDWVDFAGATVDLAALLASEPTLQAAVSTGDGATIAAWFAASRAYQDSPPDVAVVMSVDGDIVWEQGPAQDLLDVAEARLIVEDAFTAATGNLLAGTEGRVLFMAAAPLGVPPFTLGVFAVARDVEREFLEKVARPLSATRLTLVTNRPGRSEPPVDRASPRWPAALGVGLPESAELALHREYPLADGTSAPRYAIALDPELDGARAIASAFLRSTLVILVLTLGISILVASRLARFISERLGALSQSVRTIAEGAFQAPALRTGLAELDPIAESVTYLSETLQDTQRRLDSAARMAVLGQMAGGIAHDVRTPLTSISMAADLLWHGVDVASTRSLAARIQRQVDEIESLMGDLTEFARGNRAVKVEEVNLAAFLSEIEQGWESAFTARHSDLTVICDPSIQWRFDPHRIRRVVMNLIKNGLESASGPVSIMVSAYVDASSGLTVAVEDTGSGIPDDVVQTLFQPFETTKPRGTGLGLSICLSAAKDHGGTIEWRTSPEGTTFYLRIPPRPED